MHVIFVFRVFTCQSLWCTFVVWEYSLISVDDSDLESCLQKKIPRGFNVVNTACVGTVGVE